MARSLRRASMAVMSYKVVIAGGGVAALEATLALRKLAGSRVEITLLAPEDELVYRPMTVREPFAYTTARRYALPDIARDLGVKLVQDRLDWVDSPRHEAHTSEKTTLSFDALLVAVGSRSYNRYPHAITLDDRRMDALLHGLVQDVEEGYTRSVAFVAPTRMAWPLPLYELALMTAARAREAQVNTRIVIATPETTPLAVFGLSASKAVSTLLTQAGIETISNAHVEVPSARQVVIHPEDRRLGFGRIVALPELMGPGVRGLAVAAHGFLPVTPFAEVRGMPGVYAAGDATDFPIKHGGIAAQQADVAATSIAAAAGVAVERKPFHPTIRGILLTGEKPRYLQAQIAGGAGFASEVSDHPQWWPPTKIAAQHLAPYLDEVAV